MPTGHSSSSRSRRWTAATASFGPVGRGGASARRCATSPDGVSACLPVERQLGGQARPAPGGLSSRDFRPAPRRDRRGPRSPVPRSRSAPPTPSSVDLHGTQPLRAPDRDADTRRGRVFRHVGERLRADEVGRHLDLLRQAFVGYRDLDRNGAVGGERAQRTGKPAFAQHARMEPGGQLVSSRECASSCSSVRRNPLGASRALCPRARAARSSSRPGREPPLGAVVKPLLEAAALLVAGLHEPQPRRASARQPGRGPPPAAARSRRQVAPRPRRRRGARGRRARPQSCTSAATAARPARWG